MFPPDGLLTSVQAKHDVELAPEPLASNDCLNDFSPVHRLLLDTSEELSKMNPGPDEPSSAVNGRLRPRKSNIPSPQTNKPLRRSDGKIGQDKVKRNSTPSKTPPNKPDDLSTKSDTSFLCPCCDRNFASKQTLSKHVRRMHGSSSKQDSFIACLFCSHYEAEANNIVRHMAESHPQQYFACLNCHSRYPSPSQLAEHKFKTCDLKLPYRSKLRQKVSTGSLKETNSLNTDSKDDFGKDSNVFSDGHGYNGIVISCELKPSQEGDGADIEDNITTNLILPPSKSLGSSTVVEKNAVIVLDDIQWNKRIPPNFSFHNTDADQILSRLGVVHRSPRTGESSKRDWKTVDDSSQKFEKCFDTSFYSKVASNVQENLSKFLDGSFNFNPDADSAIKTRKSKNSVMINTAEGFPILLASEQYSRNAFDRYMPRAIAPKHKWKWDNLESEKGPFNPHQITRDSHTNNCIITLISSLDIWTQLRMRRKFEEKFGGAPLEKKTEKQIIINNELKEILESRELPISPSRGVKVTNKPRVSSAEVDFPASLGLGPSRSGEAPAPAPAVLSGEWVRPRCYVCCACGAQSTDSRAASSHASTHHPNAQVQHYEIVGEQLLNADIVKHLYVPPSQMCNRTRPLRGFRECTKCTKSITLEDLHQHMLDCAGDTPTVRRKCRYRPFGVRRRRTRLPDNTIRKKIRKDIRTRQTRAKSLLRPRPIRTEVGDAETIRKMIADLPAKRHRVLINPNNPFLRPRIKQRSKLLIKGRPTEDQNKRKKSNNKESDETQPRSPVNDGTLIKSDEDKPLKPKVKRNASRTLRRTDTNKRKSKGLNRPIKKKLQVKEIEKNDANDDKCNSNNNSKNDVNEDLPVENSQKYIDIHSVEFQAKEHVGRGNSSNRDGQQPSCSGQNGNSDSHCAPVQNVPLKHSIARLTADSEKHDKSVQFHHLFLVQQECNNVNQHIHSGQQLLFENEAAVLTLDKPPLQSISKVPVDASLQKNKSNKPRKGLNACIAMLKNKLVEPATDVGSIPTGHVSVQCGDDEPLYSKPDTSKSRAPAGWNNKVENIVQAEEVSEKSLSSNPSPEARSRVVAIQDEQNQCTHDVVDDKDKKPSMNICDLTTKPKPQNIGAKRESARRKSLAKEAKTIEEISQFDLVAQKDITASLVSAKSISPKNITETVNPSPQKDIKQYLEGSKSQWQATGSPAKSKEQENSNKEQQLDEHMPLNKPQILINEQSEMLKGISSSQTMTDVHESTNQEQSNDYYGNCLNLQHQTDLHIDCEYNRKNVTETYSGADFSHLTINIRPAHASTNVESIVSIPLDLSGKVSNANNTQNLKIPENAYLLRNSYDTYETLDLSNKNQDLSYRADSNLTTNNEIVDLSIKNSHSNLKEVDVKKREEVTDLSFKSVNSDVPTDLTVKKKEMRTSKVSVDKTDVIEMVTLSYDDKANNLSKQVESQPENELSITLIEDDRNKDQKKLKSKLADLSQQSKSTNIISIPAVCVPEETDGGLTNLTKDPKTSDEPQDRLNNLSTTKSQIFECGSAKIHEVKKNLELSLSNEPRSGKKPSALVPKPIYDPTLKIPQYKIRAAPEIDAPVDIKLSVQTSSSNVHTTSPSIGPLISSSATASPPQVVTMATVEKSSIIAQERTFNFGSVPYNVSNTNPGSIYSITNCVNTNTTHLSKCESTTPVYTLANACISVTKIESPNSKTLTNTLLSVPGTTIAKTTPVYTLAGTTIGVPAKYSHIVPTSPDNEDVKDPTERYTSIEKHQERSPSTSSQNTENKKERSLNPDQDPETARKIALLPKELVDILGNMPVDHRNQLLNVLPQYVSTPMSFTGLRCDLPSNSESADKITVTTSLEQKEVPVVDLMQKPEPKATSPNIAHDESEHMATLTSVTHFNFEKNTLVPSMTSTTSLLLNTGINLDGIVKSGDTFRNSRTELEIALEKKKADISQDSFDALPLNRLPSCQRNSGVIDLTNDEVISRTDIQNEPPLEVSPQMSLLVQPKRTKVNNDQTASLRAVRIKAPSERQKSIDNQPVKQTTPTALITNKISSGQDNEVKESEHVNVSLNTDVSLAIQQAEVSSTQHSNKNIVAECKFPQTLQETSVDETNNCPSRRTSNASKDQTLNSGEMQNTNSVAKTTLVSSSIVSNDINKESTEACDKNSSLLSSGFSNTKYISNNLVLSSESDSNKEKHSSHTVKTSTLITLENSKSCQSDLPIECSKAKSIEEISQDQVPVSINRSQSNICEEQEDSDDDLSLAVICKQKLQNNLKKTLVNDNITSTKKCCTKKKKVKKTKKKVHVNSALISSILDASSNNNSVLSIAHGKTNKETGFTEGHENPSNRAEDDLQSVILNQSIKKKDSKLRLNKLTVNILGKTQDEVSSNTIIECDIKSKTIENATTENDQDQKIRIEEASEVDDKLIPSLKDDICSPDVSRKRLKGDNAKVTNAPIQYPVDESINISRHTSLHMKEQNMKNKIAPDDIPPPVQEHEYERVFQSFKDVKPIDTEIIDTSAYKEISLNSSNTDVGLLDTLDATSTDVPVTLSQKLDKSQNTITPLRRSRRRKSVSLSVEEESLPSEALLENRTQTPLTKKQLIFSKLLLDEENNVKPQEVTVSKNTSCMVPEVVQAELVSVENKMEKNKPVKRKKSPHIKRKFKRKKDLISQPYCDDKASESQLSQGEDIKILPQLETKQFIHDHFSDNIKSNTSSASESEKLAIVDTGSFLSKHKSLIVCAEKRKSPDLQCSEFLQNLKPKKSKRNKSEIGSKEKTSHLSLQDNAQSEQDVKRGINVTRDTFGSGINCEKKSYKLSDVSLKRVYEKDELENSNILKQNSSKLNESDLRLKTCYNMPAAGRRTRSKSAVVKTVVYDPYDIDMDDLIEPSEPLRCRITSSDQALSDDTKQMKNLIADEKDEEKNVEVDQKECSLDSYSKNHLNDSDDSSKSDIPLKKYVEDKEKKKYELVESVPIVKNNVENEDETCVSSNEKESFLITNSQTTVFNSSDKLTAINESEERLRSEQFMESFGFFSERKPRKSNLLATKKISETFHIIANECDDMYFGFKERNAKKAMQNENRKSIEGENSLRSTRQRSSPPKKTIKRGRKKKISTVTTPSYCYICKKEFHRPDNYIRHQMSLLHVSKLSEVEMKVKTVPVHEEPNYLIAYKEHLDRIKIITDKMTKRKKNSKSAPKITPLSLEEILADVNKIVREQQLSHRGLSCDEELFLDCCELLKESHKKPEHITDMPTLAQDTDGLMCTSQSTDLGLDLLGKSDVNIKCDSKNDGDVDSITAKTILESEEVRNLENDLISGLKEAANASNLKSNVVFQHTRSDEHIEQQQKFTDHFSSPSETEMRYDHEQLSNCEEPEELDVSKTKKYPEFKEKMYPDIEEIDMFEDKFDKIKRKCRSQAAAAAKHTQQMVEPFLTSSSRKSRKKSEKKKGKKSTKTSHPSAVLTKGALKGFDGIKVSIPTSEINISAIVSPIENAHKRKKKGASKKKREHNCSESSIKYDSDHLANDRSASLKNVDVYEFMDNEDVELFEFRPSTLMERFKSISSKETPSTSRAINSVVDEADNSNASASDGDDFVYMSDDYVCSDDETENSLMSCDASNTKIISDSKKLLSQMKRRDVVEKNAVMGKIFKNNALRSEKKMTKSKELVNPKANLDQLFDSLLEEEPSSSMLNDESLPLKDEEYSRKCENSSPCHSDALTCMYEQHNFNKIDNLSAGKENDSSLKQKNVVFDNNAENYTLTDHGPSPTKISMKSLMGEHKSFKYRKHHSLSPQELKSVSTYKNYMTSSKQQHFPSKKNEKASLLHDDFLECPSSNSKSSELKNNDSKSYEDKSPVRKVEDDMGISCDYNEICDQSFPSDETGVARQRARRKCTVGKQNVLAESWSSESEPDGGPQRPNSAESLVSGTTRKKKGKKKEGYHTGGRRGNNRHISCKKQDIESRVYSSNRNTTTHLSAASITGVVERRRAGSTDGTFSAETSQASTNAGVASRSACGTVFEPPATPPTSLEASEPMAGTPSTSAGSATAEAAAAPEPRAPDGAGGGGAGAGGGGGDAGNGRFRTVFFWSPEDDESPEQHLRQQHGWIVGDSHKKLVTMLAHAKGRKRNNDDKRHLVE